MKRRNFIAKAALGSGALLAMKQDALLAQALGQSKNKFKLNYAPHFGMFENSAGKELADQLQFMSDSGFRSLEDNGLPDRSTQDQEKIGSTLAKLSMSMGVFVVN